MIGNENSSFQKNWNSFRVNNYITLAKQVIIIIPEKNFLYKTESVIDTIASVQMSFNTIAEEVRTICIPA